MNNVTYYDSDEVYSDFYTCAVCHCSNIMDTFKFCPDCGAKIDSFPITEEENAPRFLTFGEKLKEGDKIKETIGVVNTWRDVPKEDIGKIVLQEETYCRHGN